MAEIKNKPIKKYYRIIPNEGKITFRIEELWEGGVVRRPFGSSESAIKREEAIAKDEGFIDELVLVS
jgi:hypothetical protein